MVVVDTGIILALVFKSEDTEFACKISEAEEGNLLVPSLIVSELRNVIAVQKHRIGKDITIEEARQGYEDALLLIEDNIQTVNPRVAMETTLKYEISGYDAEYVTLSQDEGLDFVSTDKKLVKKLRRKGYLRAMLPEDYVN